MSATGLSRRRVKALVRYGQAWVHEDGAVWSIRSIDRKSGMVGMSGSDHRPRWITFGELGKHYRLSDEMARGP